jgi:hypothetical protein
VGEFKKAQKNLNEIIRLGKINLHSTVYKAARMLSMVMQFHDGNQEYLEYEIRSYRRAYQKQGKLLKVEKLLFKVIQLNPGSKITRIKEAESNKILAMLDAIAHDKYEVQILKHFNFTKWIREIVYNDRKCY